MAEVKTMSKEEFEAHQDRFLAAITAVSREFGLVIEGCGCCGSPFVWWAEDGESYDANECVTRWKWNEGVQLPIGDK